MQWKNGEMIIKLHLINLKIIVFASIFTIVFNGCSYENKNTTCISETELKQLEDNVDDVVKSYFKEKYDVQAAVTYKSISGGVFLGSDSSSEKYYNLNISITDGDYYTECNAEVYGKRVNKEIELYVKNESYYGKLMRNKMIQWIDPYILQIGLNDYINDYIVEYSCTEICFPSEYSIDLSADSFIALTSKNKKLTACFNLIIPESEYIQHENLSKEFYNLKNHLKQIDGKIILHMYVYDDKDYNQIKSGSDSHFKSIVSKKILDNEF